MTALLDANVLIALTVTDHVHHDVVEDWYTRRQEPFATCPITEAALVRFLIRSGATAAEAVDVVSGLKTVPRSEFWTDEVGLEEVELRGVIGHRQVTDAYLAALTRHHSGRLATLDRGLGALHADVALLLDPGD